MEKNDNQNSFSKKWMILSMVIFIIAEVLIGGLVGNLIGGSYMSMGLRFLIQGILQLISFFVGGFFIGVISPGIRIKEPAVGAFLSVAIMLVLTFFTPYSFIHFSITKVIIGGVIAFGLALIGARMGERVTQRKKKV